MPDSADAARPADGSQDQPENSQTPQLTEAARDGFALLFDSAAPPARDAAERILGERSDAEDALQTVFLRAMSGPHASNPGRFDGGYFVRGARNAARDTLRKYNYRSEVPLTDDVVDVVSDLAPTPDDVVATQQERQILRQAIEQLPPRCREVVERVADGFTRRQVAEALGISVKAVERQMTQAYARLGSIDVRRRGRRRTDVGG